MRRRPRSAPPCADTAAKAAVCKSGREPLPGAAGALVLAPSLQSRETYTSVVEATQSAACCEGHLSGLTPSESREAECLGGIPKRSEVAVHRRRSWEEHAGPDAWPFSSILGRSHAEMRALLPEGGGKTTQKTAEDLADLCSSALGKVEFASDKVTDSVGTRLNKLLSEQPGSSRILQ